MKTITIDELQMMKKHRCDKGKHKFRENAFGVSWCVLCGQLGGVNSSVEKLTDDDILVIK